MNEQNKSSIAIYQKMTTKREVSMTFHVHTFPFSNLLTLFLQLMSCRSPVSPWSPIRQRKTDASVPLPPTFPVQTVTLYFITTEHKHNSLLRPMFLTLHRTKIWKELCRIYLATAQESILLQLEAPSPPHCHPHWCPAIARRGRYTSPWLKSSSELPGWKIRMTRMRGGLI